VAAASSAELRTAEGRGCSASRTRLANQDEAEALGGRPFVPGEVASFFEALSAVRARLVVTAGRGRFRPGRAGARSRPGAAGPRREHGRCRRRRARWVVDRRRGESAALPGLEPPLAERPADARARPGRVPGRVRRRLAAHDPAGRGMGATALVPGPARRALRPGARGPRGVAA
jgi:hypothetical protein